MIAEYRYSMDGISVKDIDQLLKCKAKLNIKKDQPLKWNMFEFI